MKEKKKKRRRKKEINENEIKEEIAKINKTKNCVLEKISKTDKPFVRCIKTKREKTQINKIRNKKRGYNTQHGNTKDHKRLLQATTCQ